MIEQRKSSQESLSKGTLELTKQERRRNYMRAYMRKRRKKHLRIELLFDAEEQALLDRYVVIAQTNRATFCKRIIIAVVNKEPLCIEQDKYNQILLEIKKIGNLINQVVRVIHTYKRVYPIDIKAIETHLKTLKIQIQQYFEITIIPTNVD